jgi:CheY-like chemotaxis protein
VHSDGPGKGSEFVVRLPVVTGEAYRRPPVEQECPNPTSALRILVVDDNQDASASLAMLLKMMGNTVQTAADGEEAVRAAGEFRPHVVLCDIGLPKLNGYEACRRMKQLSWDKKMTLVAVTGWGQSEDRQRAEEAGFDYHMVKPVDPHVLMQLLAKLDVVMV